MGKQTSNVMITTQCFACDRGEDGELWETVEGTQVPQEEGFLEERLPSRVFKGKVLGAGKRQVQTWGCE